MLDDRRKVYDSHKSDDADMDMDNEVFGWCMRALHTLIGYHVGLCKMFCDSCKSDVDIDTDSDVQDRQQEHVAGICKAAVEHALRSWMVQAAEVGAACCYDFVALVVTVVVSCEVFGWCMRASHTLIGYYVGLPKMFCNSHKLDVNIDMDSNEQDQQQEHVAGICKATVHHVLCS
jgi:hypothetical protein